MEILTEQAFEEICRQAKVLVMSKDLPKVLETPEGKMIKLFINRKKIISKNLFWPSAKRFVRNARRLAEKDIPSIHIEKIAYCPSLKRYVVIYPKIQGQEVRRLALQGENESLLIIAQYIAVLHDKGIFFRAIHLGNIILNDTTVSIMDMVDLKIVKKSLGVSYRVRNIFHILKNKVDFESYKKFGVQITDVVVDPSS